MHGKIVVLRCDRNEPKAKRVRDRLDGHAPVGALLRDRSRHGIMRARLVPVAGWPRAFEQNVDQAQYLARLVEKAPELELVAPVPLNVVCFRYAPAGSSEAQRNEWNREILMRLQERGIAAPSSTVLGGRFAIRAAIVNHRSTRRDFEILVDAVVEIGAEVRAGR